MSTLEIGMPVISDLFYYEGIEFECTGDGSVSLFSSEQDGLRQSCFSDLVVNLPENPSAGDVIKSEINEKVTLVLVFTDEESGTATFAVTVDHRELNENPELHLCPLCGDDGPFDAECILGCNLLKTGKIEEKFDARLLKHESIRIDCINCNHWDERRAFRVGNWMPLSDLTPTD